MQKEMDKQKENMQRNKKSAISPLESPVFFPEVSEYKKTISNISS